MQRSERRALLVSKGWIQAVALVILFGFFVLGLLAYRTYTAKPPMPQRVVSPQGVVLYTGEDISKGQQVFLHNGLMEYGSVFGHGAYLGPDFTADYLRRASEIVTAQLRRRAIRLGGPPDDRGLPHEPLRRARAARSRSARRRWRRSGSSSATTRASSRIPTTRARTAARRDHRPHRAAPAHRVLRLDGVGRLDRAARARTTPTRTTGRPSRASTTSRRRTSSSGRCCR